MVGGVDRAMIASRRWACDGEFRNTRQHYGLDGKAAPTGNFGFLLSWRQRQTMAAELKLKVQW